MLQIEIWDWQKRHTWLGQGKHWFIYFFFFYFLECRHRKRRYTRLSEGIRYLFLNECCWYYLNTQLIFVNIYFLHTKEKYKVSMALGWKSSILSKIDWVNKIDNIVVYSSEIRGLCLMKGPSEMLQSLPYFIYTKTQSFFFHFSFCTSYFIFSPNECPVSMLS